MKRFVVTTAVAAAVLSVCAGGTVVQAGGSAPPVDAAPAAPDATSSVTLTLLGSPLVVDVTTDAGGGLVDVTLTPADGYDPAAVRPNRVSFVNAEGGAQIKVSAKHGGERIEARAGTLGEISGDSGWSGDVFDSGDVTNVGFTIGASAEGGPDITGVSVESPLEHTIGDVVLSSDDDPGRQSARVTIEFSRSGQTRSLTIKAKLYTGDEGETRSSLKISLSRTHGRLLADGPAVGSHTWSGQLCDGTPASLSYAVSAEGAVTDVVAVPEGDVRSDGHRTVVTFAERQRVSIKVSGEGETLTVATSERIRCDRTDPTVNGEAVEIPDEVDGDGHHGGWNSGDWGGGDHDGDRGQNNNRWGGGDGRRDGDGQHDSGDDGGRRGGEGDGDHNNDGDRQGDA